MSSLSGGTQRLVPRVALPPPGGSVRCTTLGDDTAPDVRIVADGDQVRVEYSHDDPTSGRAWVYLVRQFTRDDPELQYELSRLRPVA